MKIFFLIFILFFTINGYGASITMVKDSEIYCGNDPNRPNDIYFVQPSSAPGGSTSTESAIDVYIPIFNSGYFSTGTTNADFSIFTYLDDASIPVSTLPSIGDSNAPKSYIRHFLNITAPNPSYLYAGWVNPQNKEQVHVLSNKGVGPYYISSLDGNNSNLQVNFYLDNLCEDELIIESNPCFNLKFNSEDGSQKTNSMYFFISGKNNYSPTDDIDIKNNDDILAGIYFNYILSNIVPTSFPSITTVAKGDERIKINYTGNGIQQAKDVIGVKYDAAPWEPDKNLFYSKILEEGGVIASSDNGTSPSGSIVIKGLENSQEIWVRTAYLNKWGFASYFSNAQSQTPEKIQTFLQEKECYLLSAGFQREHYILEYFRNFRDKILLKNSLGRTFVQWYYNTAPVYAKYIYDHGFLRNIVKGMGYFAYFILRFFPVLLFIVLIPLMVFTYKKFSPIKK